MTASTEYATANRNRLYTVVPALLVGIVLLLVVPVPSWLLDFLLAFSITISTAMLFIAISLEKPLSLSAFPSILLFVTLLRLSLNVASTRLILLRGNHGSDAAGKIIQSFGEFMIGGNYVVGAALFILLVIINFIVITKGAGRVAEVAARFTLDGMPGKQMSIDADLASGAITQEEASQRRSEVEQEADFFGAMDGASKFVRGDAIAGLLITAINIIVGFIVGIAQLDMSASDAAATYTILSVGDGLVSQIPALLVSTAAGVVVTRTAGDEPLSGVLVQQIGRRRMALNSTAAFLGCLALLPGTPIFPFATLSLAVFLFARSNIAFEMGETAPPEQTKESATKLTEREQLEEMLPVELLELEVGFDLVPLVDASRGGELVDRIAAIRRNLAGELGILIPSIRIRDNLQLSSGAYRLLLSSNEIGGGELRIGRLLAMDPTGGAPKLEGEKVKEPAFGLDALWIAGSKREKAENLGYTVVDPATVLSTHLTELLRGCAAQLMGRSEAQELIDIYARREPRVVDELIPNLLSLGDVIKVLRNLLNEGVSIRDLRTIFEALADNAREIKDTNELTERVRQRLSLHITARFRDPKGKVAAVVLDPRAEEAFRQNGPTPNDAQAMLSTLDNVSSNFAGVTTPPVLICAPDIRKLASDFFVRRVPGLSVISYREIDPKATVRTLGVVSV